MATKTGGPKNYAVVPKNLLEKILSKDGMYLFGKDNQNMVKSDLTIFLGEKRYCKCKNIDEALKVMNYYF